MAIKLDTPRSLRTARSLNIAATVLATPGAVMFLLDLARMLKWSSLPGPLGSVFLVLMAIGGASALMAWFIRRRGIAELFISLRSTPGIVSDTIIVNKGEDLRAVALLSDPGRFILIDWSKGNIRVREHEKSNVAACVMKRQYSRIDSRTGGERYGSKVVGGFVGGAIGATIADAVTEKYVRGEINSLSLEITLKDQPERQYTFFLHDKATFAQAENVCSALSGTIMDD